MIEVAIVMVVVGLLAGGGVGLMGMLIKRKVGNETVDYLKQAKEALISYTNIHGRLPWADTNNDGYEDIDSPSGNLPYLTISVRPTDPHKRVLKYEINARLGNDRGASCDAIRTGLSGTPEVVDADGAATAFSVAAVLISAGTMDAGGDGDVFDAIEGEYNGNNTNGNPNYIRHPPNDTFDDLLTYIGSNELYGKTCEYLLLAVNKGTSSPATVYVYDQTREIDLGTIASGNTRSYYIISGTRIEIRNAASGVGSIVDSTPQTPVTLAGGGCTIYVGYPSLTPTPIPVKLRGTELEVAPIQ